MKDAVRSKLRALHQVEINAKDARALLAVADIAYAEAVAILGTIRQSVEYAIGTGAAPQQRAVRQIALDGALDALSRVAEAARYGGLSLTNGTSSCRVTDSGANLLTVKPRRIRLNPVLDPTPFRLTVDRPARQATAAGARGRTTGAVAAVGGPVTLRLTGPSGWIDLPLPAGATGESVAAIVNQSRARTGVYAREGLLLTERFGSKVTLKLEQISGTGTFGGGDPLSPGLAGSGAVFIDRGEDVRITMDGAAFTGEGNAIWVDTVFFSGWIEVSPATNEDPARTGSGIGGTGFSIGRSGLSFQVGVEWGGLPQPVLGLASLHPEHLGAAVLRLGDRWVGGALNTLRTGAGNDLFTHPENAWRIVLAAQDDVDRGRAAIATFLSQHLDPKERAREVAVANLEAADHLFPQLDLEYERFRQGTRSRPVLALVS